MRSGTEAMPLICGFGAACQAGSETMADDIRHMERLRDLARQLLQEVPGLVLLGAQDAPHIVNFSIPGLRSQGILNCLQSEGVYVSAGSACARGHRSHVLEAMGVDAAWIDGSVRVSLSDETTEDDIRALAEALPAVLTELRGGGRRA